MVTTGSGKKATTSRGPAFLWSGGTAVVLPALAGQADAEGLAASDAGLVVGGATIFTPVEISRPTWWENTGPGYQPRDWNNLVPASWGITLLLASAISSDGQYVTFMADLGAVGQRDIVVQVELDATGKIPVALVEYWNVCDIYGITSVRHDGAGLVLVSGLGGPDVDNPGAFLWVKDAAGNTSILDRHSYADSGTGAWGVALDGSMAGFRRNGSVDRAVVWNSAGTMSDIGTLGGFEAVAEAINDAGMIVGWATTPGKGRNDGAQRAFRWNGGTMADLNTLIVSGPTLTSGRAINNAGQILCWSGSTPVLLTPQ
jgi:probable HAF family extracellular repeat protein